MSDDHDSELDTSSDPNFDDYVKEEDFIKNTGIGKENFPPFALKELQDNGCDFVERYHKHNDATIDIQLKNDSEGNIYISVTNLNTSKVQVFKNLIQMYNYSRSLSSKSDQYKVTKGYQGDANKRLGTMPYISQGKNRNWKYPITFIHNGIIEEVYIDVDRKLGKIIPTVKRVGNSSNDISTTVSMVLPADKYEIIRLKDFVKLYALFNTYTTFRLFLDGTTRPTYNFPALHPIPENYENPNSIYCYDLQEFTDLLNDIVDKNLSVYEALRKSEFRELNQRGFDFLKNITVGDITDSQIKKLYNKLKKSMLPMSKLSLPYSVKVMSRKDALLERYKMIKPPSLQVDVERAQYARTKSNGHIVHVEKDKNGNTIRRYPYIFEVLAIPIKPQCGVNQNIIISGVNYSTSITNEQYFGGHYTNEYEWTHSKTHRKLSCARIEDIIRLSMTGEQIDNTTNIKPRKQRAPCVLITHLVAPRIKYRNYGKSQLELSPFSTKIAETIQKAILRLPLKSSYSGLTKIQEKEKDTVIDCLRHLLTIRWIKVRANPDILNPWSEFYDPWSQSTVFYHLRDEHLLRLEQEYGISIIKDGTRERITAAISEVCDGLDGKPTREQLGIFASPRATMYFKGQWYNVDIKEIPVLAGKGTDVIFIEKRGVVEQLKHISDLYGVAFVNTQGHFAEYPKDLVPAIVEQDGHVFILTDFDCAGIHIAEKVISELADMTVNVEVQSGKKTKTKTILVTDRVIKLGIDLDTLKYFVKRGLKTEQGEPITLKQFQRMVEESYPVTSDKDKQQQPGPNVVSPIIEYARNYYKFDNHSSEQYKEYERYGYIYDNFEYLTGLDVQSSFIEDTRLTRESLGEEEPVTKKQMQNTINEAMRERPTRKAKRIELDSVIKVVKARMFAEFVTDKIEEYFPERDLSRGTELPEQYFGEKFHILPESVKEYFQYVVDKANEVSDLVDKKIRTALKKTKGLPFIDAEDALNEKLRYDAVSANRDMKKIDTKCAELLQPGVLPPIKKKVNEPREDN
jgi:5S rRNA maturation endonuclease (ribonuclease M5)